MRYGEQILCFIQKMVRRFYDLRVMWGGVLWRWVWRQPFSQTPSTTLSSETEDTVVTPRTLFSPEECTLFNLVKLAVQDHWLVLGKLSPLQLIAFSDKDEEARRAVMRTLQTVRLDMVLVHPGTRQAQTVIKFRKDDKEDAPMRDERTRLTETALKAAGIRLVELNLNQRYSMDQLAGLLGLAEEE